MINITIENLLQQLPPNISSEDIDDILHETVGTFKRYNLWLGNIENVTALRAALGFYKMEENTVTIVEIQPAGEINESITKWYYIIDNCTVDELVNFLTRNFYLRAFQ